MRTLSVLFTLICLSIQLTFCQTEPPTKTLPESVESATEGQSVASLSTTFSLADFYTENYALDTKVNEIYDGLSQQERVGQMIVTAAGHGSRTNSEIHQLIRDKKVGGVAIFKKVTDPKTTIAGFNATAKASGAQPLLFSIDAEPSLINYRLKGIKQFPKANAIKTETQCNEVSTDIAEVLLDRGIHHNYAPVCDLSFNKAIINNRSFGNNIDWAGQMSKSFIQASQNRGVATTAKHFPGHGAVKGDSHTNLVYIDGDFKELDVFKSAIDAGVISIMVGHIAIKNNEYYNTYGEPSTLSAGIIKGLLRTQLGFKGIVITDAMEMGAVSNISNAGLKAVYAGNDIILMPNDETVLLQRIILEMNRNPHLETQIEESVKRILRMKVCLGLY